MMKKFVPICIIIMILFAGIFAYADEVPTAKVTATLVGDEIPVAGEKFNIAINMIDISSQLFVSGEVRIKWSEDAVSLVDYYEDEPIIVANDYCIGNIYNEYAGRSGKFTYISNFDDSLEGYAAIAIYIPPSARSQEAEQIKSFTMFEMSFMLNEGYTYDDFYLTIVDSCAFLAADKQTVSSCEEGKIQVEGIGKTVGNLEKNVTGSNGHLLTMLAQTNAMNTDWNVNINFLYNDEYNETVLIKNTVFKGDISIINLSSEDADVICYVAEYNSDNTLIGFTRSNTITVSPESMVTENIEYSFADDAVKAKVFCWNSGTLMPVIKEIVLTTEATDYYADTYSEANVVDVNKQICGEINISDDVDIVKISTTEAGNYIVKFSADNTTSYVLIDSEKNVINATAVDNNYSLFSLQGNSIYYLKMTGGDHDEYHIKPMLSESTIKNIGLEGCLNNLYDYEIFEFVPETTGEYIVTAVGTEEVKAVLYNSAFEQIKVSDNGDDYVSFRITYDMTADEKYYIVVEQKSGEAANTEYELYVEEPFEIISIY